MRKRLIIIGARGYGRECLDSLRSEYEGLLDQYELAGFLDSKKDALDGFAGYPPILSSVEDYQVQENDRFICALGASNWRKVYTEKILAKGGRFDSFIHPKAMIRSTATIGQGVTLGQFTTVSSNVTVGDFALIHAYCDFGHDVRIGTYATIESYSFCGGFSSIGENATLHTRSTILPHIRVGVDATVGAGSVVLRHVKPGTVVFGNPARRLSF